MPVEDSGVVAAGKLQNEKISYVLFPVALVLVCWSPGARQARVANE